MVLVLSKKNCHMTEKQEFGNYCLTFKVDAVLAAIAFFLEGMLKTIDMRSWSGIAEITSVQKLHKDTRQRIPDFSFDWLKKVTGIKHAKDCWKSVRKLESLGILRLKKGRVVLTGNDTNPIVENFIKKAQVEVLGLKRSLTRWLPIDRSVLKHLARSSARTEHFLAFFSYVRAATMDKYQGLKNTGTIKLVAIERLTKCCHTAVAAAAKKFRELSFFSTERPKRIGKLLKDGLFITLNFSKKLKDRETKKRVNKEKKQQVNSELPEANINDIDRQQLGHWRYLLALYWSAIRKNVLKHSELTLLDFFSAAKQVVLMYKKGKTKTPEKLLAHLIRNRFEGVTDEAEKLAHPRLKQLKMDFPHLFVF